MEFVCEICGVKFTSSAYNARYCSPSCAYEAKRAKQCGFFYEDGVCPICGTEFARSSTNQIFCSAKCRNIFSYGFGRCVDCTKVYLRGWEGSRTCPECSAKRKSEDSLNLADYGFGYCKTCGTRFKKHRFNQAFCGAKCRGEYDTQKKLALSLETANRKKKESKMKKSLDDYTREALEVGMSYGQYRAALKMGKTYEQLLEENKSDFDKEW